MHASTARGDLREGPVSVFTVLTVNTKATAQQPDFGAYLERLMNLNGYSRDADLARDSGAPASSISRIRRNITSTPDTDTLRKIAPLLNVRLGDLMISAGLATGEELGTVGSAPPPLPPVVRDILARLDQRSILTDRQKRALLNHLARSLNLFDEMLEENRSNPPEPQMRRR